MAHTPGPWVAHRYWVSDDTHYHGVMARASDDGREVRVCSCLPISDDGQVGGESNCNARLIAAAPELLAALIDMRDELNSWVWDGTGVFGVSAAYNKHLNDMILKAIAKATGKESE